MKDVEMIALAAHAAGIKGDITPDGSVMIHNTQRIWNPLRESGDAFDLAVKLHLRIGISELTRSTEISWFHGDPDRNEIRNTGRFHQFDPFEATRRAIVEAAADIGKHHPFVNH